MKPIFNYRLVAGCYEHVSEDVALLMEAASTSETLVNSYQTTRHNIFTAVRVPEVER
jgi:hypothetical protein